MRYRLVAAVIVMGVALSFPLTASANGEVIEKTYYDATWTEVGYYSWDPCAQYMYTTGDTSGDAPYMVKDTLDCFANPIRHQCYELGSDGVYHLITCPPGF